MFSRLLRLLEHHSCDDESNKFPFQTSLTNTRQKAAFVDVFVCFVNLIYIDESESSVVMLDQTITNK